MLIAVPDPITGHPISVWASIDLATIEIDASTDPPTVRGKAGAVTPLPGDDGPTP